jgi:hypothetical protein
VGFESIELLTAEASKTKASGGSHRFTQTASNNKLQLEFGKIHHSILMIFISRKRSFNSA